MILPVIAGKTINVPKKHTNTAKIHIQIRFTIAHVLILVSADWPGLAIAKSGFFYEFDLLTPLTQIFRPESNFKMKH